MSRQREEGGLVGREKYGSVVWAVNFIYPRLLPLEAPTAGFFRVGRIAQTSGPVSCLCRACLCSCFAFACDQQLNNTGSARNTCALWFIIIPHLFFYIPPPNPKGPGEHRPSSISLAVLPRFVEQGVPPSWRNFSRSTLFRYAPWLLARSIACPSLVHLFATPEKKYKTCATWTRPM